MLVYNIQYYNAILSLLTVTYSCPPLAEMSTVPELNPTPPPTVITVGNEGRPRATGTESPIGLVLTFGPNIPVTSEGNTDIPSLDSSLFAGSSLVIMGIVIAVSAGALLILFVTVIAVVIIKRQKKRLRTKGFNLVDPNAAFSNQVYMNRHSG